MELSSLKMFIAVAETGGVSTAAQQLHCVQSNVTARIKKLEDEVGAVLFLRKNRGMELSTQGTVLLDYAYRMVDLERQAIRALGESAEDGGTLSLGSMETAMAVRLPNLLKSFHQSHPKTELSVRTGTTDEMIDSVLKRKLDCAIVGIRIDSDELDQFPFFEERLVLVSAPGMERMKTLLVYRQGCAYRAIAERWLRQSGRLPYTIMEFGTQEGILGCVSAGLGVTLLPYEVVKNTTQDIVITDLPDDIARVQTYMISRKDLVQSKPLKTLMGLAKQEMASRAA